MRKTVSLIMLWSMIVMTYTGIMLFIAPQGKVAYWVDWKILGLSKTEYGNLHVTFMVLFIIATLFHIFYNWLPIKNYMKDKIKGFIFFTKYNVLSLLFTFIFIFGTLYYTPPFSNFLDFESSVKQYWEDTLGSPPFGHAELAPLKKFCFRMGYDIDEAIKALEEKGIKVENANYNLKKIADENGITPAKIYDIIFDKLEK